MSERLCRDPEIIHGSDVDCMPCGHVQAGTSRRVLSSAVKLPPGLCSSEIENKYWYRSGSSWNFFFSTSTGTLLLFKINYFHELP